MSIRRAMINDKERLSLRRSFSSLVMYIEAVKYKLKIRVSLNSQCPHQHRFGQILTLLP